VVLFGYGTDKSRKKFLKAGGDMEELENYKRRGGGTDGIQYAVMAKVSRSYLHAVGRRHTGNQSIDTSTQPARDKAKQGMHSVHCTSRR
jgi:hypothetical protein